MLERDIAEYDRITAAAMPPVAGTQAAEYTPERTVDWTDDELAGAVGHHHDDPAAQDQILETLQWREDLAAERDAEIAALQAEHAAAAQKSLDTWEAEAATALTTPVMRTNRRLTPDQQCREAYTAYVYDQYLAAETDCRGSLLSREGQQKGIDPETLFSGPAHVAAKYASEELRTWWSRHGRMNATQFRYAWFGRNSDRDAARTSARQSLGEAAA